MREGAKVEEFESIKAAHAAFEPEQFYADTNLIIAPLNTKKGDGGFTPTDRNKKRHQQHKYPQVFYTLVMDSDQKRKPTQKMGSVRGVQFLPEMTTMREAQAIGQRMPAGHGMRKKAGQQAYSGNPKCVCCGYTWAHNTRCARCPVCHGSVFGAPAVAWLSELRGGGGGAAAVSSGVRWRVRTGEAAQAPGGVRGRRSRAAEAHRSRDGGAARPPRWPDRGSALLPGTTPLWE